MKIYMVIADNGESYEDHARWNVDAFSSPEAATEYINKLPSIIAEKEKRIDELCELKCTRELTNDEEEERFNLLHKWGHFWHFFDEDRGDFEIQEYEVLD